MGKQRKRPSDKRKLSAGEQQLKAAIQQLHASEQQLKAANQQLDASNQQLRASEQEIRRMEENWRESFNSLEDVMILIDRDFNVEKINANGLKLIGKSEENVVGKKCYEIFHGMSSPAKGCPLKKSLRTKKVESIDRFEEDFGRHFSIKSSPIFDEKGEIVRFVDLMRDITERKMADGRYRDLVEKEKDIIYTLDDKGRITSSNPAVESILGYRPEELIGKHFVVLIPEDWRKKTEADFNNLLKRGEITAETVLLDKEEQPHFVEYSSTVIKEGNKVVGTRGIVRDITERRKVEEALRESEEKFRKFFENEPEYCYMISPKGNILDVNDAALTALGYKKEQLVGKPLQTIYAPEALPKMKQLFPKWKKTGHLRDEEMVIITKNGDKRTVLVSASAVRDKSGKILHSVSVQKDITERKETEEELKEERDKLQKYLDVAGVMFLVVDADEKISLINKKGCEILGYAKEEVVGKNAFDTFVPERMRKEIRAVFSKLMAGEIEPVEYYENPWLTKRGEERIFAWHNTVLKDEQGNIIGTLSSAEDITKRKQAEEALQAAHQQLRASEQQLKAANQQLRANGQQLKAANEQLRASEQQLKAANQQLRANEQQLRAANQQLRANEQQLKAANQQLRASEQQLRAGQGQLKQLASQLTLAEESERHRIATELHATIGQSLAISKLQLDTLRATAPSADIARTLGEVCESLDETIQGTRSLTFDLSSPLLYELGFEAAVAEWLTERIEERHRIATEFEDDEQPKALDDEVRIFLFRDVRELLMNVVKHAQAKKVKVSIRKVGSRIEVSVEDDGWGFDPEKTAATAVRKGGFGLFSIRERLAQLGGKLEIESAPGQGTKVTVMAPLKEEKINKEQ